MAKIRVTDLGSASTPLSGAEELLVVQGGIEKKVATSQMYRKGVSETVADAWTFSASPAVPSPSGASDATPKSYVDGVAAGAPVGSMLMWAAAAAPVGYLLCDGAAVSRTTYADLFTAIGTTWGSGDGSTTFNIPDMRGAAPAGVGTSTGYTQNETLALGTKYNDQLHGHWHGMKYGPNPSSTVNSPGFPGATAHSTGGSSTFATPSNLNTGANTTQLYVADPYQDGTNGPPRTGNVTRGKRVGVNFIIKAV